MGVVVLLGVYVRVKLDTTPGVTVRLPVPESPPLAIVPPDDPRPSLTVTEFPALQLPPLLETVIMPDAKPMYAVLGPDTVKSIRTSVEAASIGGLLWLTYSVAIQSSSAAFVALGQGVRTCNSSMTAS